MCVWGGGGGGGLRLTRLNSEPYQGLNLKPQENRVDGFFLTHTQSIEIANCDIIFTLSEQPQRSELFLYPYLFRIERIVSLNSILGILPITSSTQ